MNKLKINTPTIIVGENLSGKTYLSQLIHKKEIDSEIISTKNHSLFLFRKVWDELYLINSNQTPLFCKLVERLNFDKLYQNFTSKLSGGEKQLLQILLSIKYKTRLFIFDDNLEMLSSKYKEIIYDSIIDDKKELLVTDVKIPRFIDLFKQVYLLKNRELIEIHDIHSTKTQTFLNENNIYYDQ